MLRIVLKLVLLLENRHDVQDVLYKFGDESFEFRVVSSEENPCWRRVLLLLSQISEELLKSYKFSALIVLAFQLGAGPKLKAKAK